MFEIIPAIRRLTLAMLMLLTGATASASTIPLQFITMDNLVVIPYISSQGEARAEFRYRLDPAVSAYHDDGLSGWLTLDVAQTLESGDYANYVRMGFTLLDDNDFTVLGFWDIGQPLDGIDLYASGEAMAVGQASYHRGEYPFEIVTGTLGFRPGPTYSTDTGFPFVCIECGLDVYLNFLYMDYSTGLLQLDLTDARTALFYGQDYFSGNSPYGWDLNMTVRPIPLPAAWITMLSGLMIISALRGRGA